MRWVILGACVIVAGGGAAAWHHHKFLRQAAPVVAAQAAGPVVPGDLMLSGHVTARNIVSVAAPIEGTLEAYFVEPGAQVFEGQLLGRIANPKLEEAAQKAQSDLTRAEVRVTTLTTQQLTAKLEQSRSAADLSRARSEAERLQKLYDRQDGLWKAGATARLTWEKSKKDFEDAKAELDKQESAAREANQRDAQAANDLETANREVAAATAALEKAKAAGAAGEIHSPVDGVVTARQELVGQMVDPSMKELMKIGTDLTQLVVEVDDTSRLHDGMHAAVRMEQAEFTGTVEAGKILFETPMPVDKLGQAVQVIIKF